MMNTPNLERQAHSADVQMQLTVSGHILSIGHLGPDYVILGDPIDHPPADAQISLSVDGKERRWRVLKLRILSFAPKGQGGI